MITIPETKTGPTVKQYVNDEIHITGKGVKKPRATLSFTAIDDAGARIADAPVPIVTLEGEGYNLWYEGWDGEMALYQKILELLANGTPGVTLSGANLSTIGGINNIAISEATEEITN